MKANLHWIKKLLQVSFVPAEIRPGKSFPEIYMVPPPKKKKPTSLHVLLVFAPVVWLCHKESKKLKKPRENQKHQTKQYSRTLAKAKIQKTSRKPKKTKKNTIFQDSCKSKKAKIQKTSRKPKKTKKTIFQKSGDGVNRQESWNIVFFDFFGFFGFLEVFWIFAFLLLQESWNIVFFFDFFVFFWFSRGFFGFLLLQESCFFCFFLVFGFSRGFFVFVLAFFLNFFVLEIWPGV